LKKLIALYLLLLSTSLIAQDSTGAHYNARKWTIGAASAAAYAGSLIVLNEAWYKNYPKTSFHSFNDSPEWLQVDKIGHAWTAYNCSRATTAMWRWAGFRGKEYNKAILLGSLSGFSYLTVIELLDAHSANWGWSWTDIAANTAGTALFAVQEVRWREQKIDFKFSSHRKSYPGDLTARANNLYGSSFQERLLKDYNAQSYWISVNMNDLVPKWRLPPWLSLAVGYGAEGLFGGFNNSVYDENGLPVFIRPDIKRRRQWYLAPDVDLTKIKTRSSFLRTAFATLNCLKFPAPALEFQDGRFRFKPLVF